MSNRVSIARMAEEISSLLQEYADLATDEMKTAVKNGQSSPKEFEDWIIIQSSVLYDI